MAKGVPEYVKRCVVCSQIKSNRYPKTIPQRPHKPVRPWQMISIDILGPYTIFPRGNQYIYVTTDCFSKWEETKAHPSIDVHYVEEFLEKTYLADGELHLLYLFEIEKPKTVVD